MIMKTLQGTHDNKTCTANFQPEEEIMGSLDHREDNPLANSKTTPSTSNLTWPLFLSSSTNYPILPPNLNHAHIEHFQLSLGKHVT